MRGDVTRQTFRSRNHYRSVLQQQGRVQLDADWNEQADIQAYLDQTVTADLIGGSGAPRGTAGMLIGNRAGKPHTEPVEAAKLWISRGHYYVDGIFCENDDAVQLEAQPDLPGVDLEGKKDGTTYIAYLDVWLEHVTRFEDPLLQEVALRGPDTTTRARTIWQMRLREKDVEPNPADTETLTARKPQMRARAVLPTPDAPTPCVVGPAARYRRLENQLYRVEVFDPTPPPEDPEDEADKILDQAPVKAADDVGEKPPSGPTFLWSRENGSVVAVVTDVEVVHVAGSDPTKDTGLLTIAAPGRDDRLAFKSGDWVEITDRARTRRGERGFLVQLGVVDEARLPIARWYGTQRPEDDYVEKNKANHPVARRWDGKAGPQPLFPEPAETNGIQLEDGIHVEFEPTGVYRSGDYWLIPARTANLESVPGVSDLAGNIEWPTKEKDDKDEPLFQPPAGVVHHYADIATLTRDGGKWTRDSDDRSIFDSLNAVFDVAMAGGDGQESLPDEVLDEPLRVAVTRGLSPVKDATVRFTTKGGGLFVSQDPATAGEGVPLEIKATTNESGIATCEWQLNAKGDRTQLVTARLLDGDGQPTGPELGFTASLSLASGVQFDPKECAALDGTKTVDEALHRLADTPVLVPGGGNGQTAAPEATLGSPVEVQVRGCGKPVPGATVQFSVAEGAVTADTTGSTATGVTDADGRARCQWKLGRGVPVQTLTATLLDAKNAPNLGVVPLTFLAIVVPKVLTTARVELPTGTALVDGAFVAATDLAAKGTAVVLDGEPADSVTGSPALTVTLDLPYPISESDRAVWGFSLVGSLPLGLRGTAAKATVGNPPAPAVTWTPAADTQTFLDNFYTTMREIGGGDLDRVRGHVRLAGSVLGPAAVDDTGWFWLVEKVTHLVLVPHSQGLLQGWAQRAIALSLRRDLLRPQLRAGIAVADGELNLEAAETAAKRIFNSTTPPRPLQLVVDGSYAPAGEAVKAGLAAVHVGMDLIDGGTDPAAKAAELLTNNATVDGVLTDAASTAAVEAVDGFTKPVPL